MSEGREVFAVFQEGVYRHSCAGIFDTVAEAIETARYFWNNAGDEYHDYHIHRFVVGARAGRQGPIPPTSRTDGDPLEAAPIFKIVRSPSKAGEAQLHTLGIDYTDMVSAR